MQKLQPPEKIHPLLSQESSSKNWDLIKPPLLKIWQEVQSTPFSQQKKEGHTTVYIHTYMHTYIHEHNICNTLYREEVLCPKDNCSSYCVFVYVMEDLVIFFLSICSDILRRSSHVKYIWDIAQHWTFLVASEDRKRTSALGNFINIGLNTFWGLKSKYF